MTVRSSPALVLKGLSTQEQKDNERKRKREGGDTSKREKESARLPGLCVVTGEGLNGRIV